MNAEAIRTLYEYHFALNRRVWNRSIAGLTDEQFTRDLPYSLGSIRDHVVHVASVDQRWFARIRGGALPDRLAPGDFPDRRAARARWDAVEADMRTHLDGLTDAEAARPVTFAGGRLPRRTVPAWQILVHVVNHGTDHRAQMLAMLHGLGAPTLEQDLMLWLGEREAGRA